MKKIKIKSNSLLTNCLKGALIALVISLIAILIFAFIIKTIGLASSLISPINQVIKALSIFVGITFVLKKNKEKGLIKGLLIGLIYTLLAFVIFSILSGGFSFDKSLFNDCLFGAITGMICGVISVNIKAKTTA